MAVKTPSEPPFTQFDSWRQAFGWAFHVARTSHQRVVVRRQANGRWGARRIAPAQNREPSSP